MELKILPDSRLMEVPFSFGGNMPIDFSKFIPKIPTRWIVVKDNFQLFRIGRIESHSSETVRVRFVDGDEHDYSLSDGQAELVGFSHYDSDVEIPRDEWAKEFSDLRGIVRTDTWVSEAGLNFLGEDEKEKALEGRRRVAKEFAYKPLPVPPTVYDLSTKERLERHLSVLESSDDFLKTLDEIAAMPVKLKDTKLMASNKLCDKYRGLTEELEQIAKEMKKVAQKKIDKAWSDHDKYFEEAPASFKNFLQEIKIEVDQGQHCERRLVSYDESSSDGLRMNFHQYHVLENELPPVIIFSCSVLPGEHSSSGFKMQFLDTMILPNRLPSIRHPRIFLVHDSSEAAELVNKVFEHKKDKWVSVSLSMVNGKIALRMRPAKPDYPWLQSPYPKDNFASLGFVDTGSYWYARCLTYDDYNSVCAALREAEQKPKNQRILLSKNSWQCLDHLVDEWKVDRGDWTELNLPSLRRQRKMLDDFTANCSLRPLAEPKLRIYPAIFDGELRLIAWQRGQQHAKRLKDVRHTMPHIGWKQESQALIKMCNNKDEAMGVLKGIERLGYDVYDSETGNPQPAVNENLKMFKLRGNGLSQSSLVSASRQPGDSALRNFALELRSDLNKQYASFIRSSSPKYDKFRMENNEVYLNLRGPQLWMWRDDNGAYCFDIWPENEDDNVSAFGDLICKKMGWDYGKALEDNTYRFFEQSPAVQDAEEQYKNELHGRLDDLLKSPRRLFNLLKEATEIIARDK